MTSAKQVILIIFFFILSINVIESFEYIVIDKSYEPEKYITQLRMFGKFPIYNTILIKEKYVIKVRFIKDYAGVKSIEVKKDLYDKCKISDTIKNNELKIKDDFFTK